MIRRSLAGLLAVAGLLFFAGPGRGQAAADPQGFISGLGNQVLGIIKMQNLSAADRQKRFRNLFVAAFDAPTIGRFVLSRYWSKLSDAQRKDYINLFSDYVAALYAVQFSGYKGESFKTVGTSAIGNQDTAVRTEIDQPGQKPIPITFRVRKQGQEFKIVDVAVEGVSLIVTKREEFSSVLSREGFDGVMKRMRAVLDQAQSARS